MVPSGPFALLTVVKPVIFTTKGPYAKLKFIFVNVGSFFPTKRFSDAALVTFAIVLSGIT